MNECYVLHVVICPQASSGPHGDVARLYHVPARNPQWMQGPHLLKSKSDLIGSLGPASTDRSPESPRLLLAMHAAATPHLRSPAPLPKALRPLGATRSPLRRQGPPVCPYEAAHAVAVGKHLDILERS
jgi:hypothetical protein